MGRPGGNDLVLVILLFLLKLVSFSSSLQLVQFFCLCFVFAESSWLLFPLLCQAESLLTSLLLLLQKQELSPAGRQKLLRIFALFCPTAGVSGVCASVAKCPMQ